MALIGTIVTSGGVTVNLHDTAYSGASEAELSCRRENLLKAAEQIAQETQQRRLREEQSAEQYSVER